MPIKGTYTPVVLNHVLPTTRTKSNYTSNSSSSRTNALTNTTPSIHPPLSMPATSNTFTKSTTIPKDKLSTAVAHSKNSDPQSSIDVKTTTQPSFVNTTSHAHTVNKSKNRPQNQSAEKHHKSPVEIQHNPKTSVEPHGKVGRHKAEQKDTKMNSEPHRKAVSHQSEQNDKRTTEVSTTKGKDRNVPSSKSTPRQQVKDLSHVSIDSSTEKFTGPPPKISTLISLAMAKSSAVVSEGSQDSSIKQVRILYITPIVY